jgi:hypothetical protein
MGKNKYIETPEKMWEYFEAYRKEVKDNPRFKNELDKFGNIVPIPLERPLSIDGFECWCHEKGIISDLSNYFANSNNNYDNYSTICYAIRKAVRNDQIDGGMVGQYNASITQRLNGLVEKQEVKHDITSFDFGND